MNRQILLLTFLALLTIGAGPKTHQYVGESVSRSYSCGAIFPDWGTVSGYGELSVVAHSEAFREAYGSPDAFIRGVAVHAATDILWDSGFKAEAMAQDEASELDVEMAVDIFLIIEHGARRSFDSSTCQVDKAVRTYGALGHDVTGQQINDGLAVLQRIMLLERIGAWFVYPDFVSRLPWTHANYYSAIRSIINEVG